MDNRDEEELRKFESTLQNRTTELMTSDGGGRSFSSLISVIRILGDTNQDVVKVLLRSKDAIHGSSELHILLTDYFNCSHKTFDFLNALELWLSGANGVSWRLGRVKSALKEFKANKSKTHYERELLQRAFTGFAEACDPVNTEKLYNKLTEVLNEQTRLHERLLAKKHDIDFQDAGRLKAYRRVSTVILAALYVGLVVCAAVSAALSPALLLPPLASIAAIASMNPTERMGAWMDHMWGKYERTLTMRGELVNALMEGRSRIMVEDLERIRVVVQGLQAKFQSFSDNVRDVVALSKDSDVKAMVGDLEKKIDQFSKAIEDLKTKKDKCYKDVMNSRAKIFGTSFGKKV